MCGTRYLFRYLWYLVCNTRITPKHRANKPATLLQSVYEYGSLSLASSWLAILPSRLFCRPCVVHEQDISYLVGLTAPPANKNSNLVPSSLVLLPARMDTCFCFIYSCFFATQAFGSMSPKKINKSNYVLQL